MSVTKILHKSRVWTFALLAMGCSSLAQANDETRGPNGEQATPYTQVSLTQDQQDQVKAKNYTAAILMHSTSDWSNALIAGAKDLFSSLNIKVVAVTDAEFDANKQKTDVETIMAMKPDILIALVVDPFLAQRRLGQRYSRAVN